MKIQGQLKQYLDEELGIALAIDPAVINFPRYLQSYYQWYRVSVRGVSCWW